MYPLVEQKLPLFDVGKHWARCLNLKIQVDKWDPLDVLHRAWWQGEFEIEYSSLDKSLRRTALKIMRELPPPSPDTSKVVFFEHEDELPPAAIWHGDVLEELDHRYRIRLPANPALWTEADISEACEALAKVPPENLPDIIRGPLLAMLIQRDVFAAWCDRMGWERPFFWFAQPKPSARIRITSAGSTGCRRFLRELAGRGRRFTKKQVWEMALERFPQLSKAEFTRLWKTNVPKAWQQPGRPKKQPASRIDSSR